MLRMFSCFPKKLHELFIPLAVLIVFAAAALPASAQEWALNKDKSRISFEADVGGQILTGEFQQFEAELRFDPDHLDISEIAARIDINTVSTGQPQPDDALRSQEWFDAQTYPMAGFRATSIEPTGTGGMFMMTGDLTIKGNTKTVTIPFTLQIDQGEGAVVGEAAINRRNFGIGPDGPISGMIVGDLVKIRLDLVATRLDN
jgi:polyisoprenoid-binding protein YceI